ncbi:MAG: SDR family oxidoreductase [Chloroflexota bacterium]
MARLSVTLAGKVAVVTGAGRGIGRALAEGLAAEGAQVVGISRTASELSEVNGLAAAHVCDVADAAAVAELASWLEQHYGHLDVLVNNAGLRMIHVGPRDGYRVSVEDLPVEDWDRMLAVNLRGPFLMCKLLLPLLRRAGAASVANISAGGGTQGEPGRAPYCASKFGLEALTQSLAAEWRDDNIAVNTLSPGMSVLTDAIKVQMREANPELRHAVPEAMVPPLIWLVQQPAAACTGQRIVAWESLREHGQGGWERWAA